MIELACHKPELTGCPQSAHVHVQKINRILVPSCPVFRLQTDKIENRRNRNLKWPPWADAPFLKIILGWRRRQTPFALEKHAGFSPVPSLVKWPQIVGFFEFQA